MVATDHGQPVGVVTLEAFTDPATPGALVAQVMDDEVVRLDPHAGEIQTLHAFQDATLWVVDADDDQSVIRARTGMTSPLVKQR